MKNYLVIIFISYLFVVLWSYWLKFLNFSYLKKCGTDIPSGFEGHIDKDLLERTREYTLENSRLGLIESVVSNILLLVFLFGGLLHIYNSWISSLHLPFIVSGILFFIILSYTETFISVPFSLYSTFRIENKYGFRTITWKLWISDFLKSTLLSTLLMGIVLSAAFWIIHLSPHYWWLWVWGFFLLFSLFMTYISPYVIEPLFHKFTPIEEEGLEEKIKELMKKVNIMISKVFKIDASKRSRHTNAYFTGIGRVKRIILYDTLLEKMNHDEIIAVLAHEAGHWKKKHIFKQIIVLELLSLIGIYISFRILQTDFLTDIFQIKPDTLFAKLVILGFIGSIISFPFTPLSNYIARRFEKEADIFAVNLIKDSGSMTRVLIKLTKDNLANLYPHPLYATFYYSHPPVVQRVKYLSELSH